jgi:hypothetical protein
MSEFTDVVGSIGTIFRLIADNTASATLSVIGIVLLIIAIMLAVKAVRSKPEEMPAYLKAILFVSLIGGMVFSAVGPAIALFYASSSIQTVSLEKAFDNLENNERVNWLIRLIPFDPVEKPELGIGQLSSLGPKNQRYTFVASYEELRGYPVSQAVRMIGGNYVTGNHVSGIIFQLGSRQLYPANARGLLQVIREVEEHIESPADQLLLRGKPNVLNSDEVRDLNNIAIYSWRWQNYRARYAHYCELAHQFRCNSQYAARSFIGGVEKDWHPVGLAQDEQEDPCLESAANYCKSADWKDLKKTLLPHFGSRAFLIQNLNLNNIGDRYLIEFGNPAGQVIPDTGYRTK